MRKEDKAVALSLVKAQICSDGGKNYWTYLTYSLANGEKLAKDGYKRKRSYIVDAIKRINKDKSSSFVYHVVLNHIWEGFPTTYLVYFSFRTERGGRRQISFHVPYEEDAYRDGFLESICQSEANRKNQLHWDRRCSRDTAEYLLWLATRDDD